MSISHHNSICVISVHQNRRANSESSGAPNPESCSEPDALDSRFSQSWEHTYDGEATAGDGSGLEHAARIEGNNHVGKRTNADTANTPRQASKLIMEASV